MTDTNPTPYAAWLGIDWADQKHAYSLQVTGHPEKETGILEQKPEVLGSWLAQLRQRFGGQPIAVALEQSRGALLHALLDYDFLDLYPLHPNMVGHFREAFKSSGAKSDPLDANQILEILTKHTARLQVLRPETAQTRLLKRLTEDRRKAVDLRTGYVQALAASLKEYFPQALELLSGNLTSRLAADFLQKWPSLPAFQQAKASTLTKFFYGHNIRSPQVLEKVFQIATYAQALTTDAAIVESGVRISQLYAQLIQTFNASIEDYDRRIAQVFDSHPEAPLFRDFPGAGPALAPRLLAFLGSDRSRYQGAENIQSFTGIAPVTQSSGHTRLIHFRVACPKFARQTFHEWARLSITRCQWARNYFEYHRAKGKKYHPILRGLAFKWIRILFRCWQNRTPYNEQIYMDALKKRGSIYATYHQQKNS